MFSNLENDIVAEQLLSIHQIFLKKTMKGNKILEVKFLKTVDSALSREKSTLWWKKSHGGGTSSYWINRFLLCGFTYTHMHTSSLNDLLIASTLKLLS